MAQNHDLLVESLVDATYYFRLHPDAVSSGLTAAEHFLRSGWTLGYDPNPYFSTLGYLADNPDVASSGMNPLLHYVAFGAAEGRIPSALFDADFYLAQNADVAAAGVNPLLHFMQFGVHEGRDPNAFFSVNGYLAANPDVAAAGVDPYAHYLTFGWHEGRNPSGNFNTDWYLAQNPDVAAAGVNPLEHFLHHGLAEHRLSAEPVLSVSASSIGEGDTVTYRFHAPGLPAGTVYSYALSGVQAEDVTCPLTGTVTLDADGRAEITVTLLADGLTEGTETMELAIGGLTGTVAVLDTSPQTQFLLTAGIDSIIGSAYDDIIGSTIPGSFAETDFIDGGDGTDVLYVVDDTGIQIGVAPIVINVEQAYFGSLSNSVELDTTPWTGLEELWVLGNSGNNAVTAGGSTSVHAEFGNVGSGITRVDGGKNIVLAVSGFSNGSITVGGATTASGTVSVSSTSDAAVNMGPITVTGGTSISITQSAGNPVASTVTMGVVQVTGSADTTSVSVTAMPRATASGSVAGVNTNSVAINDVNYASATLGGTITSVTAANYTTLGFSGTGLTTLNLSGGTGNMILDNSGLGTPTNRTLGLTVDRQSGGTLDDADIYTTLYVSAVGSNSTFSNITFGAMTTMNVDGDARLTLTSTAGMTAVQTVTVAGAAGLTADLSGHNTLTSITTSATIGASTITLDADKTSFTGGAGVDRVTHSSSTIDHAISLGDGDDSLNLGSLSGTPGAALSGGGGTDTLTMTAALAATASGSNAFAGMVTGFEKLVLNGATNQTVDLAVIGIPGYVATSGGNGLTLSNLANGGTLELTGAGTAYTIGNTAFTAGADDLVHLVLRDGSGASVSFAATGLTMSRVEHVDIQVLDTQAVPSGSVTDMVTLLGNSSQSITIAGNAGLTLTATSTALTSVDASGITLGGFTWNSGILANAINVHGSAAGTNTVDLSAATQAVTYTGGSGDDSVTATNGRGNVIALGDGVNSFIGSSGNHTVTAGDGNDTVVLTTGNNTVFLGNGSNSFTASSGNNTYVGGTGSDTVTLGGGMNSVALGAGADTVNLTAAGSSLHIYTTLHDIGAGDTIVFADKGTESFTAAKVVLGQHAIFQDYANAVVTAGGNASVNGAFGWFQFGQDTYLVEGRHDASGNNAEFINGVDMIVELSGLIDLSTAIVTGQTILIA